MGTLAASKHRDTIKLIHIPYIAMLFNPQLNKATEDI